MSAKSGKKAVAPRTVGSIEDFLERLPSMRTRTPAAAKPTDRVFASMPDDPIVDEAARLGAVWRNEMNRRAEG